MSVVQDILKRHKCSFDIVSPSTINLDGWPLNMCPVLELKEDGISFICPISYYVTDEQRALILESCQKNRARIWYSEFGCGLCIRDSGDGGISAVLPESVIFDENREDLLITAHFSLDGKSIMAAPDGFYDTLQLIEGYALALRNQTIGAIIYDRMVKTKTDPSDPRTLFYCSLLLYCYRNKEAKAQYWLMVDFNDVKTMLEYGREVVFYPSLTAETFDGLVYEMGNAFRDDLSPEEKFDILVTLTLPENCPSALGGVGDLRIRYWPNNIKTNIYVAEGDHPFTAEMVLVKMELR